VHPRLIKPVVISGQLSADALKYQEAAVKAAIEGIKK
jgi:hypothetical protein